MGLCIVHVNRGSFIVILMTIGIPFLVNRGDIINLDWSSFHSKVTHLYQYIYTLYHSYSDRLSFLLYLFFLSLGVHIHCVALLNIWHLRLFKAKVTGEKLIGGH